MRAMTIEEVRRRATRIFVTRVALAGGVVGGLIVAAVLTLPHTHGATYGELFGHTAIGFGCTSVLSAAVLRRALRSSDPSGLAAKLSMLAAILNVLACLAVFFVASWTEEAHGPGPELFLVLIPATVLGLVFSVPIGFAYALVHYFAVDDIATELGDPTHRALSHTRVVTLCVTLAAALGIGVIMLVTRLDRLATLGSLGLLGVIAAIDGLTIAIDRRRTQRWLSDLRADRVPGLRLVPPTECRIPVELAPLAPIDDTSLAVVPSTPPTPYRELPDAVMLVPSR